MAKGNEVIKNFLWRFMERWGAQGVSLIVSIVLARMLEPKMYGTVALITIFITILQVFVDSGLGTALIQKKDADSIDFSSVFWFNVLICILLYGMMFLAAPIISAFYSIPELTLMTRVLSITLIIFGIKNIQQAYISRNLLFKKFFFSTMGGTILSAVIGIVMAFKGYGVWALVWQYVSNNLIDTVILWTMVNWRPKLEFSFERFKSLFSYGWRLLVSSLLHTFYTELRSLIIGKFYSGEELAFYKRGAQFPEVAVSNINSSMDSVLLPVLSQKQDDIASVKSAAKKVIRVSSYIVWPLMLILCAAADKIIVLLFTEKWISSVIFLRILCIAYALEPLQTTNLCVVKALGKSDLHLKLEIIKKTIAILIVITSSFFGVIAIALGTVIYAMIATVINAFPNRALIDYSFSEQFKDISPFILMSAITGILVYAIGMIQLPLIISVFLQLIVGFGTYLFISRVVGNDVLTYCLHVFQNISKDNNL